MKYTADHEWLRAEADGSVTIGITHHAQDALGDLVFVELPSVGARFEKDDVACVIESVKAAGDIKLPIGCTVLAINEALVDAPEKVNEDAEGEGWFIRVQPDDSSALDGMLDAAAYKALLGE